MKKRSDVYQFANGDKFIGHDTKEVFEQIFEARLWDEEIVEESASGSGSSLQQTAEILKQLPHIFSQYQINSVLDIPCGDFHWLSALDWSGKSYLGGDIVSALIENNRLNFSHNNFDFQTINLLSDPLPAKDLIFCRDCLVHLSFADIHQAISNIRSSKCTYLLTTTFPEEAENVDIPTGGWRPINLEKAPFNFNAPILLINEKCTEKNGLFADKSLGLWKIDEI